MENNDKISTFISSSIPDITDEVIKKLKLLNIGVTRKQHMEHIERENVEEILTPIQTRMFIKKCKEKKCK